MTKQDVLNLVKSGESVKFVCYLAGNLVYKIGFFEFLIPIEETGTAKFLAEDKGIFFLRWINRQLKLNEEAV